MKATCILHGAYKCKYHNQISRHKKKPEPITNYSLPTGTSKNIVLEIKKVMERLGVNLSKI